MGAVVWSLEGCVGVGGPFGLRVLGGLVAVDGMRVCWGSVDNPVRVCTPRHRGVRFRLRVLGGVVTVDGIVHSILPISIHITVTYT